MNSDRSVCSTAAYGPLAGDLIEVPALVVGGCIVFCIVVVGADDVSLWVAKLGMANVVQADNWGIVCRHLSCNG